MSVITRFNRALPASIQAQLLSEYGDIGRKALAEIDALLRTAGFDSPSFLFIVRLIHEATKAKRVVVIELLVL